MERCQRDSGGVRQRLGDRWQRPRAWGITYSHGDFFFFHPLSSDGNEVVHRQATQREPGVRWLGQVSHEFPSLNNDIVSHYPWGHLLLGRLISLFF